MPLDTSEEGRAQFRKQHVDDLAVTLRMLQHALRATEPAITAYAQHIQNLTDAMQTVLAWLTADHGES